WHTVETNIPAVSGYFPPNVLPEEIMSDNPERIRAVIVSAANPLRSYADTTAYEEAFKRLDLLVCVELVMSETAVMADYVLPAKSAYEKYDTTFFAWNYPEIFSQLRHPLITPDGDQLEDGEVFLRLADAMGLIPEIPQSLYDAAEKGYGPDYLKALMAYVASEPEAQQVLVFVIGKTLGRAMGSVNLASLYGLLQNMPPEFHKNAARVGFSPGPGLGDELFKALLDTPEGMWVGKCDDADMFAGITTSDNRLQLHIPELAQWVASIDPETEKAALEPDPLFPLVLVAGRHFDKNANTLMRDPAWLKDRKGCTLIMHPSDAKALGLEDGQDVKVVTEAGDGRVELEVT
ncbi:MAG: molybdopterin-dependent oxidoreductase, partial [Gammaproteobacteria bacterium]|nr:molybdopterin-dependent oxidoreductase [Gammaproteobacteria bacterium]